MTLHRPPHSAAARPATAPAARPVIRARKSTRRPFYLVLGGFFLAVSMCAAAIWQISADARRQIDALATANSDSMQWSLAQAEVEMLVMLTAMSGAALAPPEARPAALAQVRQRFDVFYSRVSILNNSAGFATLRSSAAGREALAETQRFLSQSAPIIDGTDATLAAALPDLLAAAEAMRPALRQSSLEGVRVFSGRSEQQRQQLAQALYDLGAIAALLFVGLVIAVIALAFLSCASGAQAARNASTRNRLQAVIGTSIDAIVVAGTDGRIRDFNDAATRMYGYSAKEAIGADIFKLIVPDDKRENMTRLLDRVQQHPYVPVRVEMMQSLARRRSGEVFPVEVSISAAESPDGPVMVAFVRDISRRVAEKAELIEARDRAVAGERAKARMLAVMSHEMRTPLNGVLGTLDLLKTTALDETQFRYVQVMEQSGRMLLSHVNDVLDISRADSGNIQLVDKAFDPRQLVSDVVDGLRAAAEKRGNQLTLRQIGNGRGPVIGDPGRLSQVLVNLIGNAIKFTRMGRITVEIDRSFADEGIEFRVIDTGIGICAGDLDRIFDEFVTLDASYNRSFEGTGLGLGIVRRLVLLMGGQIDVDSMPGRGATFRVRLHLPAACTLLDPLPPAVTKRASPQIMRLADAPDTLDVLVVEDNATNRMVVREMLIKRGCRVTEAEDGHEGVRLADAQPFDLILMDISMPRMDGLGATRRIRMRGPNAGTPIVALTAHAQPEDLIHFRQAGMTGTLIKPLSFRQLEEVLTSLPRRPAASTPDARAPDSTPDFSQAPQEVAAQGVAEQDVMGDLHLARAQARLADTLGADRAQTVLNGILAELDDGLIRLAALADQPAEHVALAALAHRMAGSAALIGFAQMHRGLAALEVEARRDASLRPDSARLRRQIAALHSLMPDPEARLRAMPYR